MPILNLTIRSQDLDFSTDLASDSRIAQKTFKFERTFKMKYLKLLHVFHNINNTDISDGQGTSDNTILFAKLSFLNANNSVYYESDGKTTIEHAGTICLGETTKDSHTSTYKDMYKVLHDGSQLLYLNQPFTIQLFKLESVDPTSANTDIAVYNTSKSHLIKPISIDEFRGSLDSAGQYLSLTFEYNEEYKK